MFLHGALRSPAALGALRMGIEHGGWCVGCCWALMAALFALGVMSIGWMAFIAALIAIEKLLPWKDVANRGIAVLLLVLGLAVAFAPRTYRASPTPGSPEAVQAMQAMGMEPGAMHSDEMQSGQMKSDQMKSDNMKSGQMKSDGMKSVRVIKAAEDSTLARVAALVEEAQGSRAPSERFVDRFARVYTPLVFAAALAVVGRPGRALRRRLRHVAVPGARAADRRLPVLAGHLHPGRGRLRRRRAPPATACSIKGGQALEDLARVRTVAIDKTGTLTAGRPQLSHVVALDGRRRRRGARARRGRRAALRAPARPGAASRRRAIAAWTIAEPDGFEALPGRGVIARVDGRELWAGGPRLARRAPRRDARGRARGSRRAARPRWCSARATARWPCSGSPTSRDPRPPPRSPALRRAGVERVVMLTGDNERVAAPRERAGRRRRVPRRAAARGQAARRRGARRASTGRWRWSATASTTRPRWPPRASASRWARPAPTPRSSPPTSR